MSDKEIKQAITDELNKDIFRSDIDVRWLRTQLVKPQNEGEQAQLNIKQLITQTETAKKSFEEKLNLIKMV